MYHSLANLAWWSGVNSGLGTEEDANDNPVNRADEDNKSTIQGCAESKLESSIASSLGTREKRLLPAVLVCISRVYTAWKSGWSHLMLTGSPRTVKPSTFYLPPRLISSLINHPSPKGTITCGLPSIPFLVPSVYFNLAFVVTVNVKLFFLKKIFYYKSILLHILYILLFSYFMNAFLL